MYRISHYESVNIGGTANVFDCLVNDPERTVKTVVVASSRAIYGEGAYLCAQNGLVFPAGRTAEDMKARRFEPRCPQCQQPCAVAPTREDAKLGPTSFYGLTKLVQEQMTLMFCASLGIRAYALRYQNVYGPGQSLQNPYTGILAIFSNLARMQRPIDVFEDGQETRDFVFIDDVVEATAACVHATGAIEQRSFNVGSGVSTSVQEVAQRIVAFFRSPSPAKATGTFRLGDIRHNVADIQSIQERFGFRPRWSFAEGLERFLAWAAAQEIATDSEQYDRSLSEMAERGLMHRD
jgi:dTDP-L-rhamnose 4-epimerase